MNTNTISAAKTEDDGNAMAGIIEEYEAMLTTSANNSSPTSKFPNKEDAQMTDTIMISEKYKNRLNIAPFLVKIVYSLPAKTISSRYSDNQEKSSLLLHCWNDSSFTELSFLILSKLLPHCQISPNTRIIFRHALRLPRTGKWDTRVVATVYCRNMLNENENENIDEERKVGAKNLDDIRFMSGDVLEVDIKN